MHKHPCVYILKIFTFIFIFIKLILKKIYIYKMFSDIYTYIYIIHINSIHTYMM